MNVYLHTHSMWQPFPPVPSLSTAVLHNMHQLRFDRHTATLLASKVYNNTVHTFIVYFNNMLQISYFRQQQLFFTSQVRAQLILRLLYVLVCLSIRPHLSCALRYAIELHHSHEYSGSYWKFAGPIGQVTQASLVVWQKVVGSNATSVLASALRKLPSHPFHWKLCKLWQADLFHGYI